MRVTLGQWAYIRALVEGLGMDEEQARTRASHSSDRAETMRGSDLIQWLSAQYLRKLLAPMLDPRYRWHLARLQDEAKAEPLERTAGKAARCTCGGALKGFVGPLGPLDECAECGLVLFGQTEMAVPNRPAIREIGKFPENPSETPG